MRSLILCLLLFAVFRLGILSVRAAFLCSGFCDLRLSGHLIGKLLAYRNTYLRIQFTDILQHLRMVHHKFIIFHSNLIIEFHNIILRADSLDIFIYFFTVLTTLNIQSALIVGTDIECLISGNLFFVTHKRDLVIHIGDHRPFLRSRLGIYFQSRIIVNILRQFYITIHILIRDFIAYGTKCLFITCRHGIIIRCDQCINRTFFVGHQRHILRRRLCCRLTGCGCDLCLLLCLFMPVTQAQAYGYGNSHRHYNYCRKHDLIMFYDIIADGMYFLFPHI